MIALFNAESGRSDVVNTFNDFVFTPASQSAFHSFTIIDDNVLEFDELFIAEFKFSHEIADNWNVTMGEPRTAFIVIRDDDCELIPHRSVPGIVPISYALYCFKEFFLSSFIFFSCCGDF